MADRRDNDYDVIDNVVGLARTLRAAGVDAGPERVHATVAALDRLDVTRRTDVYWAGRLTLCGSADDITRYDRVFTVYFGQQSTASMRGSVVVDTRLRLVQAAEDEVAVEADDDGEVANVAASRTEVLRHRDISTLSPADRAELQRLLATFRLTGERRRTRRTLPAMTGAFDRHRTLRRLMQAGGEPVRPVHHARRDRPRRIVLLVDVSGSMSAYADALLRFAHAATHRDRGPATEVFTIGTRLTRVTRELTHRAPDIALAAVSAAVPDWSGGTRLGVLVKEFLDRWGQRGLARGAVVVVLSDGWERGEAALLGEQMARLHRLAHRVVWANPRAGRPGFAPLAAGMAAALPHVDDFVSGHSLAALEQLAAVVTGVRGRAHA